MPHLKQDSLDETAPFDPLDHVGSGWGGDQAPRLGWTGSVLFGCIGMATWLLTSGIFTEDNQLKRELPEGNRIFANSDVSLEMGNIIPAIFVLYFSRTLKNNINKVVLLVLLGNVFTGLFIAFFYHITAGSTSWCFLVGSFMAGASGSLSMVSFFAFASNFGSSAIAALSTGIGLTGFIALMVGIAQDLNTPPVKFGVSVYFLSLTGVVLLSIGAYTLIITQFRGNTRDPSDPSSSLLPRKGGKMRSSLLASMDQDPDDEIIMYDELNVDSPVRLQNTSVDRTEARSCAAIAHEYIVAPPVDGFRRVVASRPYVFFAIFLSCLTEFGVPSMLPFLIPCNHRNEGLGFWMTFCFLTGSIGGRVLTALKSYRKFGVLNTLQTFFFIVLITVAALQRNEWETYVVPLPLSLACMFLLSFVHGYIVTEVFQSVADDTEMSTWAGLINQAGALSGSFCFFMIVSAGVFEGQKDCPIH